MSFRFLIPVRNTDLLSSPGNSYFVSRVYATGEIQSELKNARTEFRQSNNLLFIFDRFDIFFSVIEASNCPVQTAIKCFDFLYECLEKLRRNLGVVLNKPPIIERSDLSNATKMYVYLFVNTIKVIDLQYTRSNEEKGMNNKKNYDLGEFHQWDTKRKDALDLLYNVAQLPLENLYDPPVVEEDFVNLICETSYRTLQMPSVKEKRITETAFQIIGLSIKRFNHALTFPVRLLQILADKDYCITPIANATFNVLYQEFGISTIFDVLIKELAERLLEDTVDQKISKHFSQFMMDLGSAAPVLMIPHLSDLAEELLNHEPYFMRNCLLQMMGDIIVKELTGEGLADELKETRDEFLDYLFDHIHDSNAHVRSKVLQIWNSLKSETAVPLSRIHKILERAIGRLEDKSSLVRKSAIILIKSFLEHNPYSSKLTQEELQQKYDEEEAKLRELQKKQSDLLPELEEFEADWENRKTEIQIVILNNVQTELPDIASMDPTTNIGQKIGEMLKNKLYKNSLELIRKQDQVNAEELSEFTFEQKCQYYLQLMQSYYFTVNRPYDYSDEITKTDDTVKFFYDFIQYTKLLTMAVPKLEEMLMSKTNSDVFESIDFFTTAYRFGIKNCVSGMHRMIYLVWSDKEKRAAVTEAYKKVLFITDKKDRSHAVQVVENLSRFLENLSQGHYSAFEELMKEWVEAETIDPSIIQVMFERYTMKLPDTSENDSRLALQLLVLSSTANPNIVVRNSEFLTQMGIQERGLNDPRIYIATLELLINSVDKNYEHPSKYYKRYDHSSEIVKKIIHNYTQMFFTNNDIDFDTICMKTFNFVYRLCNAPDSLAQKIVFGIFETMKQMSVKFESRAVYLEMNDITNASQIPSSQLKIKLNVPSIILARFIYMVGFVAMKEMIYLDIDVYSNMKYREELRNDQKKKGKKSNNKNKGQNNRRTLNQSMDISASNALKRMSLANNLQESFEEEDLVGATAEDAIAEQINYICEAEMLYSKDCLINKFTPLILNLCQLMNRQKDEILQQSIALALIHIMSISSRFCEENIPLLMNIFKYTKNVRVKCNIIIGLSDFTFRFPNVIAPWTSYLYATLQEENVELRLTGVKMLSHLILHEMIRVKGQISNLAMCLVDHVDEIRIMTEQFFKEIAHKSNILYNVLPDIISRLSDNEEQVEEHKYQNIMKYIIALIHKDKQVESLVEKLCLRFKITTSDRQWRDIAFCLSLLTYNEKTIKKLIDHIPCYKDKVQVDEVYNSFKAIVASTMKLPKPELKILVQEFDSKLEECLAVKEILVGQESGGPPKNNQNNTESGNPNKNLRKPQRTIRNVPNRRKQLNKASSASESEDSDFENPNRKQHKKPVVSSLRAPNVRGKAKRLVRNVIEETDSSDGADQPKSKRRGRKK